MQDDYARHLETLKRMNNIEAGGDDTLQVAATGRPRRRPVMHMPTILHMPTVSFRMDEHSRSTISRMSTVSFRLDDRGSASQAPLPRPERSRLARASSVRAVSGKGKEEGAEPSSPRWPWPLSWLSRLSLPRVRHKITPQISRRSFKTVSRTNTDQIPLFKSVSSGLAGTHFMTANQPVKPM